MCVIFILSILSSLLFSGLCNNNHLEREGNAGSFGQGISLKLGHQLAKSWTQTVRKQKLSFGSGLCRGYLRSSFTCCLSQPKISGPVGCRTPGLRACQAARRKTLLGTSSAQEGLDLQRSQLGGGQMIPGTAKLPERSRKAGNSHFEIQRQSWHFVLQPCQVPTWPV